MSGEFDIRPMVENYSALPLERLRVVRQFDGLRLTEIRRGVVFVFAAWSGPALLAFQRFTRVLAEFSTTSFDLVVLDADCLTAETNESVAQLFGTDGFIVRGCGETIWVRDGVAVAREIAVPASEQTLRDRTSELLE